VRIFVYEHVTGGGMAGAELPAALFAEADLMVRTLLGDLSTCPGVELLTSRDARLPAVPGVACMPVATALDGSGCLTRGIEGCDAVWPTAPETGGALEQLNRAVLERGRILLGSRPGAVHLAASKVETARTLTACGVPVVATYAPSEELPPIPGRWVTKPDDGAGGDGARIAADWRQARDRLGAGLVAQPWIEGDAVSLSLLCAGGEAVLLSCNRQRLELSGDRIGLAAIDVNAFADHSGELARLGARIAAAIPGLWGYVGVDLIVTDRGPLVLEVNPRLTTSYCGLGRALGISVAAKVLDLLEPGAPARWRPPVSRTTVTLALQVNCEA
jgi:predicted ATP-grasp superfamily ATP-dependent carboligase